jgi:signal transduction histidine kinase
MMNNKQPGFPRNFKSVEHITRQKSRSIQSAGVSDVMTETAITPDNSYSLQLQETKARNFKLEKTIEQLNIKLTEVVATHTKFISIIAHDLRSPFHAILGALELLKLKMENHHLDDLENYIDIASNSAIRLDYFEKFGEKLQSGKS